MKTIFELIEEFMKTHSHIKPTEFRMMKNRKTGEPFFRVMTEDESFVWYYERDVYDDYMATKLYWCPPMQEYEIWSDEAIEKSVIQMIKLGQTRVEIADHISVSSSKVNRIYRNYVSGILEEKGSEYWQDIKEGYRE